MQLLRLSEVEGLVGLKKSKIYAMVKQGDFPAPLKIGRASSWLRSELEAWIAFRANLRTMSTEAAQTLADATSSAHQCSQPKPASS